MKKKLTYAALTLFSAAVLTACGAAPSAAPAAAPARRRPGLLARQRPAPGRDPGRALAPKEITRKGGRLCLRDNTFS